MWHYYEGFGWWMVFPGVAMLLFWGGLLWLAANVFRGPGGDRNRHSGDDARDIADRRLASGDIGEDEYERITEKLRR